MNRKHLKTSSIQDQQWFSSIERPSRYLGGEINTIKKDPAGVDVSIGLAFPDIYDIGMSHLGLKILYQILNSQDWLFAERIFCPWVDLENELRTRGLPLTTLESGRPLSNLDILGFSLQSELTFTNVLTMLDLAGIPFLSEQRMVDSSQPFPLIIAGGPASFNPEPVAPIFDAIVIGDGEEATLEICRVLREIKSRPLSNKTDLLNRLTEIKGVYVPHFFEAHYTGNGTIHDIEPLLPGYQKVEKALISDLDRYPFPTSQIVPFTELIHDRFAIEIARGCTRGCRFCQAGMIYRPVRERSPGSVLTSAERGLKSTGFDELSLLSLSAGDHSCIGSLLQALMDRHSRDRIAVSLPSLRVDSLDPLWFDQIKKVRKTGFTLAPEAGNDRLRGIINKTLTNREILETARQVYGAGWNLIKLYFMIGLPGEGDDDLRDIVSLATGIVGLTKGKSRKAKLHVSLSTFVPKSHTPFMWAPQITLEESRRRMAIIRKAFRGSRVQVKWNQPEMSWLEGIFSRGDRRLAGVLIKAWQLGARFDAWSEHYRIETWKEAFIGSESPGPDFYLHRSRPFTEIFPWDHIKSGVSKQYFEKEWMKASKGKMTPDCRRHCLECGVCDKGDIRPRLCEDCSPVSDLGEGNWKDGSMGDIKKVRLVFSKTGEARHLSHLETVRLFKRAFRRAGIHLVHSEGYHPLPRLTFASALPVGMESIHETLDIQLFVSAISARLKEEINQQMPKGMSIIRVEEIPRHKKSPKLKESHFQITAKGLNFELRDLETFLGSACFPITKKGKKGERIIDARLLVKSLERIDPNRLHIIITHVAGPSLNPKAIIKGIFDLNDDQSAAIKILKTKQVMD